MTAKLFVIIYPVLRFYSTAAWSFRVLHIHSMKHGLEVGQLKLILRVHFEAGTFHSLEHHGAGNSVFWIIMQQEITNFEWIKDGRGQIHLVSPWLAWQHRGNNSLSPLWCLWITFGFKADTAMGTNAYTWKELFGTQLPRICPFFPDVPLAGMCMHTARPQTTESGTQVGHLSTLSLLWLCCLTSYKTKCVPI